MEGLVGILLLLTFVASICTVSAVDRSGRMTFTCRLIFHYYYESELFQMEHFPIK